MSDISFGYAPALPARAPRARPRRGARAEYRAYLALLTAAALPGGLMGFAWSAARGRPGPSPWARARAHAGVIAPMIFAR